MRLRFVLAAHPEHPLHRLDRALTMRDLRAHRQLVVRESSPERASPPSMEASQRWTFSHMATSIEAARSGYGFSWFPEERIREELAAGTLKPLRLREGGERYADLYLIFADREHAGPATLRLAELIREAGGLVECKRSAVTVRLTGGDGARRDVPAARSSTRQRACVAATCSARAARA
jgi:DNA-binding transcriptional LysR family regulator